MLGQIGDAEDLGAGLGHRVIVLDRVPLTPMAPTSTPSSSTMGRPPGNVIRPSLECSMP